MLSVLIAGCGNFGSWWAVGLLKDISISSITIYDPYENNIPLIKSRFIDFFPFALVEIDSRLHYVHEIETLDKFYDLTIVSCNSKIRLKLYSKLLMSIDSSHWVLEKVLTSSMKELSAFRELSRGKNVYVSHSRRCQPVWQEISKLVNEFSPINYISQALGPWDLASNSFHFVDIISWLFNTKLVSASVVEGVWRLSEKRKGEYFDLDGTLQLYYENRVSHSIARCKTLDSNVFIFSNCNGLGFVEDKIHLDELKGFTNLINNQQSSTSLYEWSELAHVFSKSLFEANVSILPSLPSVFTNTSILLDCFRDHWKLEHGNTIDFAIG